VFKKSRFRRGFVEYVHLHLRHFQHHRRQMFALEAVRDVSLTGWMRAPDDLVRRVAACEEWRHVETLRIHHQGPHKSPRSNVVTLLESPHLTGLRSLRLPMLAIDADARRRLERLPVLARLSEMTLPDLDRYPDDPGPWFSNGLPPRAFARLRSLRLLDDWTRPELLAQMAAAPFWDGLRSLELTLNPHLANEVLSVLRHRLPPEIESFRLVSRSTPLGGLTDLDALYAELAARPLRRLGVQWVPTSPAALTSLLGGTSRCELRELELLECGLSDEHMAVLADSPGARHLENLHLSQYQGVTPGAAETLFTSKNLGSLVSLRLRIPSWEDGANRLVGAPGWDGLRKLGLSGGELTSIALTRFLGSQSARRLVRLTVEDEHPGGFSVSTALIDRITEPPHLARLVLAVKDMDAGVRVQLNRLRPQIWSTVRCYDNAADFEIDPNDLPPLDEDLEELDQWS
jgi:hypothetical protein